jgi:hypothetical protein
MSPIILAMALQASAPTHAPFAEGETCEDGTYMYECKGTTEGVSYSYHLSKEGKVGGGVIDGPAQPSGRYTSDDPDRWVINVDRDKMEDTVAWYAIHYQTGLMLSLTPAGNIQAVCILGADFPGRPIAVRIGTAPAFKSSEDCPSGGNSLKPLLLKGGRLLTRGYHWPYDYPVDKEGRADNFDKLLKLYAFLRKY